MEFCGVFYETGYLRAVYDRIRKLFFVFLMAAVLTVGMMGQGMETINFGSVRLKDMAGRAVAEYAAGVGTTGSFMISVTEIQISADVSADLFTVPEMETSAGYYTEDGVLFSKDGTCLLAFPPARTGNYKVPSHVTEIADGAFDRAGISVLDASDCSVLEIRSLPSYIELRR